MKNILTAFLIAISASAFGITQSTNTVWNVADANGDLVQVDKFGNLKIAGTLSATSTASFVTTSTTNLTVVGTNVVFNRVATIAPTNSNLAGLPVRVNGTNYWLILVRPND